MRRELRVEMASSITRCLSCGGRITSCVEVMMEKKKKKNKMMMKL